MSRYFVQRLSMHFGHYDEDSINLKIERNVIQRTQGPSWAGNLSPDIFNILLNEGIRKFKDIKGNDMERFYFLSGGPFVLEYAPAKLKQNLSQIETLIKRYHFIPFPSRPKSKSIDFDNDDKQESSFGSEDGYGNTRQMNAIARAILIYPDLVRLWKEEGYDEIYRDINEFVMQGAITFFPPSPYIWTHRNIDQIIQRFSELKGIGFQLSYTVIGDVLFFFKNRLNDFGDILIDAFYKIRGVPKSTFINCCFYEVTKPERNLGSKYLLDFLFRHVDNLDRQSIRDVILYDKFCSSRFEEEKDVLPPSNKNIRRLSHIVYEWILELEPQPLEASIRSPFAYPASFSIYTNGEYSYAPREAPGLFHAYGEYSYTPREVRVFQIDREYL